MSLQPLHHADQSALSLLETLRWIPRADCTSEFVSCGLVKGSARGMGLDIDHAAGSGYRVAPSEASIAVLQNLSGLAYLRLPAGLHGDLAVLHTLGQLTHLTLTGPGISGSPDALAHLRLRFLALRGTRVSGSLSALRPSSDLELLHIEGGDVQGHLSDLQGLRALESLLLVAVDVTGRIEELWKSPSPRELQLVHVPVRGSFLGSLWNLMMFKSQYTALHVSLSRLTRKTNLTHLWL